MRLWTCVLPALLLSLSQAHHHKRMPEIHVSEGHLFILPCDPAGQRRNVSWSRERHRLDQEEQDQSKSLRLELQEVQEEQDQSRSLRLEVQEEQDQSRSLRLELQEVLEGQRLRRSLGVEVLEGRLWFRPVQSRHSGVYTCTYRSQIGEHQAHMKLFVSRGRCPLSWESRVLNRGVIGMIPCKLHHRYKSYNVSSTGPVRWMKDCAPLHRPGAPVRVDDWGNLWLPEASSQDTGTYTCFLDLSVGGQNYSASWSVEVTLTDKTVYVDPHVVYPRDLVLPVTLGGSVVLQCRADLGYSEDEHTFMYWLLNHTHTDDHPELTDNWDYVHDGGRVLGVSTLSISQVHVGLLDVSFLCCVKTPVGEDQGQLWLTRAAPSPLPGALGWSVGLVLVLLLLCVSLYYCRVELLLLHRDLRGRCSKHHVTDEKLYDGIVTCLVPSGPVPSGPVPSGPVPSSLVPSELDLFCLQLLPHRLEVQWGYRLFIPGRDDCPGEAMPDALSDAVKRSRTLLLLLCASGPQGAPQDTEALQPVCYEQRVGLNDALMHKALRVILIEIGGPVDYSRLPESVQYLKRTQGALQWRPRGRLSFLCPERSFWNRLRYHMPQVPSERRLPGPGASSPSSSAVGESEFKSKSEFPLSLSHRGLL